MVNRDFNKLINYINTLSFTPSQKEELMMTVGKLHTVDTINYKQGQHIDSNISKKIDKCLADGMSLQATADACNVSKTTVVRHKKKLAEQLVEYNKLMEGVFNNVCTGDDDFPF